MIGLRQLFGVISCSVLFYGGWGLTDVASSAENGINAPAKVIIGKVVRIEGDNYVVKNRDDGKEIRLCVDKTTKRNVGGVTVGDSVMAKLGDQNHVELIITDPENQFR